MSVGELSNDNKINGCGRYTSQPTGGLIAKLSWLGMHQINQVNFGNGSGVMRAP